MKMDKKKAKEILKIILQKEVIRVGTPMVTSKRKDNTKSICKLAYGKNILEAENQNKNYNTKRTKYY